MTIEQTVFDKYEVIPERLTAFGFTSGADGLEYACPVTGGDFTAKLHYDGSLTGRLYDSATGEEYVNFRLEEAQGYAASVRSDYEALLEKIRDSCAEKRLFRSAQAQRIHKYIAAEYGGEPEFLWEKFPTYAAFRRKDTKKWYALMAGVPYCKIDRSSKSDGEIEVINVKVDKEKLGGLLTRRGFFPAYHMNKKSWVTILLDGSAPDGEIRALLDYSYEQSG